MVVDRLTLGNVLGRLLINGLGILIEALLVGAVALGFGITSRLITFIKLFFQLLLQVILNFSLSHQRQILERMRRDPHFLELLLGIGLNG